MKKFIGLLFIFLQLHSFSQEDLKTEITSNFKKVVSIDPQQTDYSDLKSIGKAIGSSRIVFLGEQDHGDAPTFLAKTRIIKYLHEKMDFDVLIFESDFWGLNEVWDHHLNDTSPVYQIKANTYSIWSRCEQNQQLYEYIGQTLQTKDTLLVSGMDCRHALKYTKGNYVKELTAFVESQNAFTADTASLNAFLKLAAELIQKEYSIKTPKEKQQEFINYLDKQTPTIVNAFWKQEFISLKGFAVNSWNPNMYISTVRDEYMAKNLLWLCNEKYKGKKIIVWAHSAHNAKNPSSVEGEKKTSMGNEFHLSSKDSIYDLGFTSLTGRAGRITTNRKYKVQKAKKESFESWVSTFNYDYGFIDLRALKNKEPFLMKGLDHFARKASWSNVFDGVFYIKDMYPCDKTP